MLYGSIGIINVIYDSVFVKCNKSSLDYVKLTIVVIWFFRIFLNTFFSPAYSCIFDIILIGLSLWWFSDEGVNFYND